jgi:hypothetical protein
MQKATGKFFGHSHDAVIRVTMRPGNVIETHEEGHSMQTIHARQAKPALKRSGH